MQDSLKELEFRINDMNNDIEDKKEKDVITIQALIQEQENECLGKLQKQKKKFQIENDQHTGIISNIKRDLNALRNNYQMEVENIEVESDNKLLHLYDTYSILTNTKNEILL